MPELPEVETTKEGIKSHLIGQKIKNVVVRNPKLRIPINVNIDALCKNKTIQQVNRRAKYIILELAEGHIIIHLGMSGHLRILSHDTPPGAHDHVDLICSNNAILRMRDPRRFGLFHYLDEDPTQTTLFSHLGPEPLTEHFNSDYLYQHARNKNQTIKSFIMNNKIVVGVGNIYATEGLFLANIHPQEPAKNLSFNQCAVLVQHIKNVLHEAIRVGGTTLKDFYTFDGQPGYFSIALKIYGRKKLPCIVCTSTIEAVVIAGRSSAFCPKCQPPIYAHQ